MGAARAPLVDAAQRRARFSAVSDARLVFAARDVIAFSGKSSIIFMVNSANR